MVVGVVVANLTDTFSFAAAMGDLAVDFVVSPRTTQEALPYIVAVKGVMHRLVAPFTVPKSGFRLLIPRVLNGLNTRSKDMLGEVSIGG